MGLKKQISRTLIEETKLPKAVRRRIDLDVLDDIFKTNLDYVFKSRKTWSDDEFNTFRDRVIPYMLDDLHPILINTYELNPGLYEDLTKFLFDHYGQQIKEIFKKRISNKNFIIKKQKIYENKKIIMNLRENIKKILNEEIAIEEFKKKLNDLLNSKKDFENQKRKNYYIPYDSQVETIQSALQILGFSLPKWGVDGKFGNETEKAVLNFQSNYGFEETGILDTYGLKKLVEKTKQVLTDNIGLLKKIQKNKIEKLSDYEVGKKDFSDSETTSDSEYAIIKPKGYNGTDVHVLFGGAHTSGYAPGTANSNAIKKYVNVLKPYANNVIIVITHHYNTLNNVKKYIKEKFNGRVKSIAGFSQGGKEVWEHADDSSLSLVGLIDPSTYEIDVNFGSNTYLYCDPYNWGTSGFYGQTRKKLLWYCNNQKKYGSQVICFKQGGTHMNFRILESFYSKFNNKLS